MNEITTRNVLLPGLSLEARTEQWIEILYQKAVEQIEIEYAGEPAELAPWKILTHEQRAVDAIDSLDLELKQYNIQYQDLVDKKALDIAGEQSEAIRGAISAIIAQNKRKRLRWAKIQGYNGIKRKAKAVIQLPPGSAGRQINSFIENHLDMMDEAGVPESEALAILAKPDKHVLVTSRAISRVARQHKAGEISAAEKQGQIRQIADYAANAEKASDIRREFINGHGGVKIPRDVVTLPDGTTLVTYVIDDEQQYSTLERKTESLNVPYGNALPILAESQAQRSRIDTLEDIKIILAILSSGDGNTTEEISKFTKGLPVDILQALRDAEMVTYNLNGKWVSCTYGQEM